MEQLQQRHNQRILIGIITILLTLVAQLIIFSFRYGELVNQMQMNSARIGRIETDIYVVKQRVQ